MPSYDFEVDLQTLVKAAQGLGEAVQLFRDNDVEDLVPTKSDVGHAAVWDAVDEFKDRWERGMNDLVGDVEEMAGRLGKVATNYAEFDAEGHRTTAAVVPTVRAVSVLPR